MSDLIVDTTSGPVRGLDRGESTVFYSIPYAAAPVGDLAFAPPQPHRGWRDVRDARRPGATSQVRGFDDATIPEPSFPGDEVLTVNVFTPSVFTPTAAPDGPARDLGMPVLVWIHGGAFIAGSPHSPWYDGSAFNRAGIVVVSVGYRVGVTGFGDVEGAPPNRAVNDWVAALEWVHRNIAAFSGDPARVTIGGQSAGAAAVLTLMGVDAAAGLFHRAIAASPVLLQMTHDRARPVIQEAAALLNAAPVASALSERSRQELADVVWQLDGTFGKAPARARPETDLVELVGEILDSVQFPSVVDGEVLRAPIAQALQDGASSGIPLLLGATAHEFNSLVASVGTVVGTDQQALEALGFAPDVAAAYIKARHGLSGRALVAQVLSDIMVRSSVAAVAEHHDPTWVYDFAWLPSGDVDPGVAFHCLDLPFEWGLPDAAEAPRATGPTPDGLCEAVHGSWASFIRGDDPGWPSYAHGRVVRRFDVVSTDVPDGYAAERILMPDTVVDGRG